MLLCIVITVSDISTCCALAAHSRVCNCGAEGRFEDIAQRSFARPGWPPPCPPVTARHGTSHAGHGTRVWVRTNGRRDRPPAEQGSALISAPPLLSAVAAAAGRAGAQAHAGVAAAGPGPRAQYVCWSDDTVALALF